jgi:hypothetical protein
VHVGELTGPGGRAVSARCVDESICEAGVVDHRAMVGGKKPGKTDMVLDEDVAAKGVRVEVTVLETTTRPLEVGKEEPGENPSILAGVKTPDGDLAS